MPEMPCLSKLARGLGPRSAGGERGGSTAQKTTKLTRNGQDPDVLSEEDSRVKPVSKERNLQRFGQADWTALTTNLKFQRITEPELSSHIGTE